MPDRKIITIKAPSILGLRPGGVELLPEALEEAGISTLLGIRETHTVIPSRYNLERDRATGMLNPLGIAEYSVRLANAVKGAVQNGRFPLMLGGDCSIIIGAMLALKRIGRYGLFFLDGHADFYGPDTSPTGEAADMDLALVTGRGPDIVANLEGRKPLVRDEDVVVFGQRDREESLKYGSPQVAETAMRVFELQTIRRGGLEQCIAAARGQLLKGAAQGYWVHLDADVIDDDEMPAVDYRTPGGLCFEELRRVLAAALSTGRTAGMSVSIFNPRLDPLKQLARKFVETIAKGFSTAEDNQ